MTVLCDLCHEPVGDDGEEINDEIYCGWCVEVIQEEKRREQEALEEDSDEA